MKLQAITGILVFGLLLSGLQAQAKKTSRDKTENTETELSEVCFLNASEACGGKGKTEFKQCRKELSKTQRSQCKGGRSKRIQATRDIQKACRSEVLQYCKKGRDSSGLRCLFKNKNKLSPSCEAAFPGEKGKGKFVPKLAREKPPKQR